MEIVPVIGLHISDMWFTAQRSKVGLGSLDKCGDKKLVKGEALQKRVFEVR